ncbi:Homeodomain-like protein [Tylopilus felleus]
MGNRKISDDLKECALDLWNHGWRPEEICEVLQVSQRSCYRWRRIFEEYGTINQPPSPLVGRTRLLTRAMLTVLVDLYAEESDLFLDEACTWLEIQHGITITPSTLSRNLQDAGSTRKILRKIAAEHNEVAREEFRVMLQTQFIGDGSEFIVIDETSKDRRTYARRYGCVLHRERAHLIDVFVRGDRYSLCAALTLEGYIAARAIPDSYDAEEFYSFIAEEVVSCLLLFLPPYSLDLSPIQESFSTFKAYIRRHGDRLRQNPDPIDALIEATGCITPVMAENWFQHMGYIADDAG